MTEPIQNPLAGAELARYARHLTLPEVGLEGQERLRAARVLLVGAGGLGSPLALYLGAAGIGRIGIVDFDRVDLGNLQRQILYEHDDVGESKCRLAAERIRRINPHVEVSTHDVRLDAMNAGAILADYDVIVDGTDNFPTRYLVNDACVLLGKPNVYGSIFRFEGQVSVFWADRGPCYRCLYPEPPDPGSIPNCAEGGVLGVLPGTIGSLQATEAIKLILGKGDSLVGRLLLFDALEMRFRELTLRKDPDCPICGERPTIRELRQESARCMTSEPTLDDRSSISPHGLAERLRGSAQPPLLVDVRTPAEWSICRLEGAVLIPLQELGQRLDELDRNREIVVYCHHGPRGVTALDLLAGAGIGGVRNLRGGIDAWSREIDPDLPRY